MLSFSILYMLFSVAVLYSLIDQETYKPNKLFYPQIKFTIIAILQFFLSIWIHNEIIYAILYWFLVLRIAIQISMFIETYKFRLNISFFSFREMLNVYSIIGLILIVVEMLNK